MSKYSITQSDNGTLSLNGSPWISDVPDDLGALIAAAPDMLEALQAIANGEVMKVDTYTYADVVLAYQEAVIIGISVLGLML